MMRMLNVAPICCPVGFSEEIMAIFFTKKSQIHTENNKNPKNFPLFKDFMLFSQFFYELCGLER